MKTRATEFWVGLFVLGGLLALLFLALQVSGLTKLDSANDGYTVTAQFSNIGSLKPRAKVSLSGVTIGRVSSIHLDKDFYAEVQFVIDKKVNKIPSDSHASILTAGLLGDNYIGLTPGFREDDFMKEGTTLGVENTESAVVLEQLISRFMSSEASSTKKFKED